MKKLASVLLVICMLATMFTTSFAAEMRVLTAGDMTTSVNDVKIKNGIMEVGGSSKRSAIGFANVDMTGVKSISITLTEWPGINGEIFRVKLDDPNGMSIGEVIFNDINQNLTAKGNIEEQTGVHTLYLVTTLLTTGGVCRVKSVTLNDDAKPLRQPVPDSEIIDNWHDTWTATDDFGRKVADYEEVGPVKEGQRKAGMFYWFAGFSHNGVTSDILREHPEAYGDWNHPAWNNGGKIKAYAWGEPVYGFYNFSEYWVRRKHAVILSNAGIDAVFLDYTNDAGMHIHKYVALMQAFQDARRDGINAPKVSGYGSMSGQYNNAPRDVLMLYYYNQIKSGEYLDTVFYWYGKPYYINFPVPESERNVDDIEIKKIYEEIANTFELRSTGEWRDGSDDKNFMHVNWLEEYPQHPFGVGPSGRRDNISLAVAINQSYVHGSKIVNVLSDPTCKGRGYSEAFGEDYTQDNARRGYFFREQSALAVDVDPEFIFVDGWNEWGTPMYSSYNQFNGTVFVDTFDTENSRDFEPSRGPVKDDYYNMLTDAIRKYKGVRPAPTASAPTTINVKGASSQWDNVGPMYYNDLDNIDRNYSGGVVDLYTNAPISYQTKVYNAITNAKVARDANNFYFYIKTHEAIKEGTPSWMHLYINTDRNYATGWAGFDYAVNVSGAGIVSKAVGNTWAWENIGTVNYSVQGDVLQIAVPRALIGETGVADFEFKLSDNCITDGDYLDFYSEGNAAPPAKFNYLYTEIAQTALTAEERSALNHTTIVKAGVSKVIIDGGKMPIYEKDTSIVPFEMNGTVYVPALAFEEILDYGYAKVDYLPEDQTIYIGRFDLNMKSHHSKFNVVNREWTYSQLYTLTACNNGVDKTLTAPCVYANNMVYVPLTYASEVFGWNYQSLGNGLYVVSRNAIDTALVSSVAHHIQ